MNPATVRLWVSKGQLQATRAGMRKWIVRRSELERMLAASRSSADEELARGSDAPGGSASGEAQASVGPGSGSGFDGEQERVLQLVEDADLRLREAVTASNVAPPSAGYQDRLRAIAEALEQKASALFSAAESGGSWSGDGAWDWEYLGHEVRPGGNRPVREGLWDRFDGACIALAVKADGTDLRAVAITHRVAAKALLEVANQLATAEGQPADSSAG